MYLFSGRRLVYRTRQWRLHGQTIPNNAPLCRATRPVTLGGSNESLKTETRPSRLTDVCDIARGLLEYCSLFNDVFPNAWGEIMRIYVYCVWTHSQNCENRLLASLGPSLCQPAWNNSAPTWRILMKFEYFRKICRKNWSFIKIGQNNGRFTWPPIYIYGHISLNSS
jgi:hypothetical protein